MKKLLGLLLLVSNGLFCMDPHLLSGVKSEVSSTKEGLFVSVFIPQDTQEQFLKAFEAQASRALDRESLKMFARTIISNEECSTLLPNAVSLCNNLADFMNRLSEISRKKLIELERDERPQIS